VEEQTTRERGAVRAAVSREHSRYPRSTIWI
jgi:hypothetical protein